MSDYIKRDDAIQALIDCGEVTGSAFKAADDAISQIPPVKVLYICNKKRCEDCFRDCELTTDPYYAETEEGVIVINGSGQKLTEL